MTRKVPRNGRSFADERAKIRRDAENALRCHSASAAAHEMMQRGEAMRSMLSDRERDVLRRYMRGDATAQIAVALRVSPNTVFTYIHRILRKLHVSTRNEAMAICRKYDLV